MSRATRLLPRAGLDVCGLALLVALAGCGYTHQAIFPRNVHTVAVPIFANRSFYRGVEFDLTEALIKDIETRTPYKVVARAQADTVLEGTIVSVSQRLLSRERTTGLPEEMELHLVVNFTWKDQRTGRTLRQRQGFETVGRYVPTHPVGQTLDVGQHQVVQQAAEDIVSTLAGDW